MKKILWSVVKINNENTNYIIGSNGDVVNLVTERCIKPFINNGYYSLNIHYNGRRKKVYLHRLLAIAFVEGYQDGLVVNHKNGNKLDNRLKNLEWVTSLYNTQHAISLGLKTNYSKYKIETIHKICELLQSGLPSKYIMETLEVPKHLVSNIKHRLSWNEVSKDFKFAKTKRYSKYHLYRNIIEQMIFDGYSNTDIISKLDFEYDGDINRYITDRRQFIKRDNKAQRLSQWFLK